MICRTRSREFERPCWIIWSVINRFRLSNLALLTVLEPVFSAASWLWPQCSCYDFNRVTVNRVTLSAKISLPFLADISSGKHVENISTFPPISNLLPLFQINTHDNTLRFHKTFFQISFKSKNPRHARLLQSTPQCSPLREDCKLSKKSARAPKLFLR